jgi:hypothetical protein
LLFVQAVGGHVGGFVGLEGVALVGAVEREAHLVQGIALLGLVAVEQGGARDRGLVRSSLSPAVDLCQGWSIPRPLPKINRWILIIT